MHSKIKLFGQTLAVLVSLSLVFVSKCDSLKVVNAHPDKYEPTWSSLDSRPLPGWYDSAKVGIFLHWSVFSVPSFGSEWFWMDWKSNGNKSNEFARFMQKNYPPDFSYQEFAKDFTAELWNATEWAQLFAKAGAKYVVLTSKHHEGFAMWPSDHSFSWNAMDVGPHRDVVGELATAVRSEDLKFGLYYSLYEWFNPMYLADRKSDFAAQDFVDKKMLPEMFQIVNNYRPSVIWVDGDWEASDDYFKSKEFLAWLYNESPVKDDIVVNDRWGKGIPCAHGGFFTCTDRFNPGTLQPHKWENAMTIDKYSWGFRREAKLSDYLTTHQLLTTLAMTISCGGNILINVGPSKDGTISPIFEERLLDLGAWLSINGEAIYKSSPWTVQNDTLNGDVWYTMKEDAVYAIVLAWPMDNVVVLGSVEDLFKSNDTKVTLLDNDQILKWSSSKNYIKIMLPDKATVKNYNAWVIKIHHFSKGCK